MKVMTISVLKTGSMGEQVKITDVDKQSGTPTGRRVELCFETS